MVTTRTGDKKQKDSEPKKGSVNKQTNEKFNKATGSLFESIFDAVLEDAIYIYMVNVVNPAVIIIPKPGKTKKFFKWVKFIFKMFLKSQNYFCKTFFEELSAHRDQFIFNI